MMELAALLNNSSKLKSYVVKGAERRYQEGYIQSTLQIRSAYEVMEQTRSESGEKVATLEANLEQSKVELETLKAKIAEKDSKLENIYEENKLLYEKLEKTELTTKIHTTKDDTKVTKLVADSEDMQRVMLEKETELKNITKENERLKMEKNHVNDEAVASAEAVDFQ
ncbi:interactor of constitutive active ROPs 2, chloroplastic-like protein [Tanacetum coccineum]